MQLQNQERKPANDPALLAEQAFQQYEFGDGVQVTDTSGWEYSTPGFERTRKVYVETEPEDDGPAPRWTLTFTVRFNPADGSFAEAYAIDNKGSIWGSMPDRNLSVVQISVKFRYFDAALLAAHLATLHSGNPSAIEDRLKVALLNPTTRPENAGYRILEAHVSNIEDHTFSLVIRAQVDNVSKLAAEAGNEYRRCWGAPDHELSVGEQLYEVLIASNANPAPCDIGIELITWRNDTGVMHESVSDAQPELKELQSFLAVVAMADVIKAVDDNGTVLKRYFVDWYEEDNETPEPDDVVVTLLADDGYRLDIQRQYLPINQGGYRFSKRPGEWLVPCSLEPLVPTHPHHA